MEYLADRVNKLRKKFAEASEGVKGGDPLESLLDVMRDMAEIIDDLTDAVDELDMRMLEIEQSMEEE
ncbi:MAG: hypothetical protein R6W99_10765 [Clostridia bacterium]